MYHWARLRGLTGRSNPRVGDIVIYGGGTHAAIYIGHGLVISALNPQVVVLGGGLMQAAGLFHEPMRHAVRRWAQPLAAEQCRIELTRLGEDAALFGAARLALLEETP
jgi:glucokinase